MSLEVASLRALAHPVRLRILSLLTGAELSASQVARELDISQANASYHLRRLAAAGEVVEAGEERIRGGLAKKYRHPWEQVATAGAPTAPHDQEFLALARALGSELARRASLREPRTRGSHTDAELWVDPETWDEVLAQVERASFQLHAAAQPPRTAGTIKVTMSASLFRMQATFPKGEP